MLTTPKIATAALALLSTTSASAFSPDNAANSAAKELPTQKYTRKHQSDFLRAMQTSSLKHNPDYKSHPERNRRLNKLTSTEMKEFNKELKRVMEAANEDDPKSQDLRRKVLERAIWVPPRDASGEIKAGAQNLQRGLKKEDQAEKKVAKVHDKVDEKRAQRKAREMERQEQEQEQMERRLGDDGNNQNYVNGNKYISYKNYANGGANGDGTDDYLRANGAWMNELGFDAAQYSLSYSKCAEVRQFDQELAAEEGTDSVFATKHFAIVRFCPAKTCMGIFEEIDPDNEDGYYEDEYRNYYNQELNRKATYYRNKANDAYSRAYGRDYYYNMKAEEYESYMEMEEEGEEDFVIGANGEGCASNYGEYMLELEDYLMLMAEYRAERFETYCDYCENCMYQVYKKWLAKNGRRDLQEVYGIEEEDKWMPIVDKALEDERIERILANNNNNNANGNYNYNKNNANQKNSFQSYYNNPDNVCTYDNQGDYMCQACPEYDTCRYYNGLCGGDVEDEYSEYFECTEVERNNGMIAYIGPHCAQDGETVTLGLYADENCYEYIGNGVDIRNWLGEDLEEDALEDYYNPQDQICIPCNAADQLYEDKGNNYHDDGNFDDEVNELCTDLWELSARCDRHFRFYNNSTKANKYYDQKTMNLACDYIDSISNGDYDEMGFVNMERSEVNDTLKRNWMQDNIYYEEYGHYVQEVSPIQIFGLCASILACCLLALWSCALRGALSGKARKWVPRRVAGAMGVAPPSKSPDVTRQDSGIMMGRSRSNMSYYAN